MSEEIFRASVLNVKDLEKQRKRITSLVNRAIREKKDSDLNSMTKLYALLYSAYAEVSFLKLIHTPNAFENSEINQIESKRNLEEKWCKCVELAFKRLNNMSNLGEIANKKQTLNRILEKYIIKPSQMRNKIAHGQWIECLNNTCTKVNCDATLEMQQLDFVKIDRYFLIYKKFQQCVLDLMLSPSTHYRDYYTIIVGLEEYIESTKEWSIETKKKEILSSRKYCQYQNHKTNLHK